ncbi:NAD(P)/FAD-dependent oxidoreductase [Thiopseudomonas denitrificans]|uniref:Aminoacetone oxidase family FAD-binding enzyme n=1 Tax=Thiopseudomonas denitrificans TaxID=1501432 RepID=A0A4R6TWJ8_9GAMM|nr:NAD(P)/FAD-dependent oxidoreductase [Thiopseudomonas denitrificans]TDQ37112.1 hypothetical protein DFQ45_109112 [Thiopseudomonas denitrificans]
MQNPDVIIIGAGAAGLFCAQAAGHRGRRVLVLDHANKAGKKILMSGGGRCNFTNLHATPADYLCSNRHFVKSALARYTPWDFLALTERHGVAHVEKNPGQLFCRDGARDILDLLLAECASACVEIRLNTGIRSIRPLPDTGFTVETSTGRHQCRSLVIATGGLSIPTMGATGFGYQVAEQFGHSLLPTRAGLVPFTITGTTLSALCKSLSGTAVAGVTARCNGTEFTDDLLFTHRGLSGPVMLQISSFWQAGDSLQLDLLGNGNGLHWLQEQQAQRADSELKTLLGERFTRKLASALLEHFGIDNRPLRQYTPAQLEAIANQLGNWQITPAGTEGYRTAEVTLGGINTDEISSKTMESKKQPGLFFIGEVLDVTGHLGGFNFQWAWASAHAAAEAVG